MPRYLVERTFPNGLCFPSGDTGREAASKVQATNADHGVAWIHSYVSDDRQAVEVCDSPDDLRARGVVDAIGASVVESCKSAASRKPHQPLIQGDAP